MQLKTTKNIYYLPRYLCKRINYFFGILIRSSVVKILNINVENIKNCYVFIEKYMLLRSKSRFIYIIISSIIKILCPFRFDNSKIIAKMIKLLMQR